MTFIDYLRLRQNPAMRIAMPEPYIEGVSVSIPHAATTRAGHKRLRPVPAPMRRQEKTSAPAPSIGAGTQHI